MPASSGFRFGPYRLDPRSRRVLRHGAPLPLKPLLFDVLHVMVQRAGELVERQTLIDEAWRGANVEDNTMTKAVSRLRGLSCAPEFQSYIETEQGHGYRFIEPVSPDVEVLSNDDLYALLANDRAWGDGLAALESLARDELVRGRVTLEVLVATQLHEARYGIVLALTCALLFDSTRADPEPDTGALERAAIEAHEACRLRPDLAEAWATLGFVLQRMGDRENALAALRRAARLEKDNWLHHCRLAEVAWGQERLRAIRDTLALNPAFAIAHFLAAAVWVAREVFDEATRNVDAGIAAMDAEAHAPPRFAGVALYYLSGLLCFARGGFVDAVAALDQEIAFEMRGHVYGRECCANAWYAKGACYLRLGDRTAARAAFLEALTRVPDHAMARAGLAILDGPDSDAARSLAADPCRTFEVVMARAALRVHADDVAGAVGMVSAALAAAPAGNTGWLLPIEPLLRVQEHRDAWAPVLALLHLRAR